METAMMELFEKYGHLLPNISEEFIKKEREQHGRTWDKAIYTLKDRGDVVGRAICDFDDYEIN